MADPSTLRALLERVRSVDEAGMFQLVNDVCEWLLPPSFIGHDEMTDSDLRIHGMITAGAYTDMALALIERVLPGRQSELMHAAWSRLSNAADLHMRRWSREVDGDYAQRFALALLAALLEAKIMEAENDA